jgi:hypothetical protein
MAVRVLSGFIIFLIFSGQSLAQTERPSMTLGQRSGNFIFRTKPTKEQKKRLLPVSQDLRKYEQFLEQPKTGIIRLMPDLGCTENINVIKVDEVCLNFIPESPYYSFREKEHTIEMLADIRLKSGYFISDGILSQGILVNLGEIDLEKVFGESEGVKFLSNYLPDSQGAEAQKQYVQMTKGVKAGNYVYKKALPIIADATYALRVIAYKGNVFRTFRGFRFDLLEGDKRIDLTLAFRVIRLEKDGSVTLLWKEVERKESLRLIFPKRKK